MIQVYLADRNLSKNIKTIDVLRKTGAYSEEELQILYDAQVKKDGGIL